MLPSSQKCVKGLVSPHPPQQCVLRVFFILAILMVRIDTALWLSFAFF